MRGVLKGLVGVVALMVLMPVAGAQFSSGSTGADGEFHPTQNITIDMNDRPDGIYHYTSVTIPNGVTVTFTPNANNTPVVWLVQGDVVISGSVDIRGRGVPSSGTNGGRGGPGGYRGGNGHILPSAGSGPGGGNAGEDIGWRGGNASHRTEGQHWIDDDPRVAGQYPPGSVYGNTALLPLMGGSGGAGSQNSGGGGGGGAILIASSSRITFSSGSINAGGGWGYFSQYGCWGGGGGGSGGSIRVMAPRVSGNASIQTGGGQTVLTGGCVGPNHISTTAGSGWARLDTFDDAVTGGFTFRGMYPVIFLPQNATPRLRVTKIAGIEVPANPSGAAVSPDVLIPGSHTNPMTIEVRCENIPVNTPITVELKPHSGANITAVATNSGTYASSTAIVSVDIPRGGGTISAKAVSGVAANKQEEGIALSELSVYETGLASNGERFASFEVATTVGGTDELVFVTESGERISFGPAR